MAAGDEIPASPEDDLPEPSYACPACEAPLYGWVAAHDPIDRSRRIVLDRCEECGLAVTRGLVAPDVDAELGPLLEGAGGESPAGAPGAVTVRNLRSVQGGIGGAQWAGLEPEQHRLHLTPRALELLLARRGLAIAGQRTPFGGASVRLMIQTLINAFTLRDNFLRNATSGRFPPRRGPWQHFTYALDWVVSALILVPATILAVPLEAAAAALGRGGILEAELRPAGRSTPEV